MSQRQRIVIIAIVTAIAAGLIAFRVWAQPAIMAAAKTGDSFFSIFSREFGWAHQPDATLPSFVPPPPAEPLPPAAIEKINQALDKKLNEPAPALPEAKERKKK